MLTRRPFGPIGFVSLIFLDRRAKGQAPPVQLTSQEDLQRLMRLLHMTELRRGANGRDSQAPSAANYDEAKANPYPDLPDALVAKSGKKVTTASAWWKELRPEIVEDFDREIHGRMPKATPKVGWEVKNVSSDTVGNVPVRTKQLCWARG